MGRPEKLNNELKESIVNCIRSGLSYKYTCYYVGIVEKTFIDWRQHGESDINEGIDSIYSQLSEEVKKAESEAILMRLKNIHNASKESWQAAAWFLERKYHNEFGRKDRHQIEGAVQIETVLSALPPELAETIRAALAESLSENGD